MKLELVPYWRSAWRFVSVQLGLVATFVTTLLLTFPDAALTTWNLLPQEIKSSIPPQYMPMIGVFFMVLSMVGRLVHQPKTNAVIADKMEEKAFIEEQKKLDKEGIDALVNTIQPGQPSKDS